MGTQQQQAHKLITVSLEKIALSRRKRSEMSLHKNLLVTTVIHKAKLAMIKEDHPRHYKQDYEDYPLQSDIMVSDAEDDFSTAESRELKRCHAEIDDNDAAAAAYADEGDAEMDDVTAMDDAAASMDWIEYRQPNNTYQSDEEANKENLSSLCLTDDENSAGLKKCYRNKRLKTYDPNEMTYEDNTSHTLRLVSVLTLSQSSTTRSTPNIKQAKDSVDIALLVNRPAVVTVAAA